MFRAFAYIISILFFSSCFPKYNTYGIEGIPVLSHDSKQIVCVVAESEATSHQENGGFVKATYSTSYWLKQYETATGKLLKKKKLLGAAEVDNPDISCYGNFDNKIWLYVNGIAAYDINSLEKLTGEKEIAAGNGVKKTLFPYGSRLVNAAVENGYIDFTADNGEQYRLQLKDLKIINKEGLKDNGGNAEKRISRLLHKEDYGVRCDTLNNNMFAFAKDITAAGNCNLGDYNLTEVAYRMKLFRADYTMRRLGNHNSFDFTNIIQQGNTTYLNPCFAADLYSGTAIHLSQPEGYLIIHQDVLGSNSKAMLTRIDTNNTKIWETAAGVSTKISDCIISGKYCAIVTNKDYMFSPHIGKDALCIIDTETGNIIKPVISE